jgi:phage shock protein A
MALFDRVSRLLRANLNDMVSKAEDPEKILDQALIDMQEDLINMKTAVAGAIATQKRSQLQYEKNLTESGTWQSRAQLALQKGDENLAREALVRKKSFADAAASLKAQLDAQSVQVDSLRKNLVAMESKISEAKTKKDMLKARAAAAKANEQLQSVINSSNTGSAMAAFEQMEDKVLQLESRSMAAAELGSAGLEAQFAALEGGSNVDAELEAMKAQMLGGSAAAATPQITGTPAGVNADADAELESLKKQMDNL